VRGREEHHWFLWVLCLDGRKARFTVDPLITSVADLTRAVSYDKGLGSVPVHKIRLVLDGRHLADPEAMLGSVAGLKNNAKVRLKVTMLNLPSSSGGQGGQGGVHDSQSAHAAKKKKTQNMSMSAEEHELAKFEARRVKAMEKRQKLEAELFAKEAAFKEAKRRDQAKRDEWRRKEQQLQSERELAALNVRAEREKAVQLRMQKEALAERISKLASPNNNGKNGATVTRDGRGASANEEEEDDDVEGRDRGPPVPEGELSVRIQKAQALLGYKYDEDEDDEDVELVVAAGQALESSAKKDREWSEKRRGGSSRANRARKKLEEKMSALQLAQVGGGCLLVWMRGGYV
jgi:hypothetical protein